MARHRQAARLRAEILPVLAAARAALADAYAMPARTPEERSLRNAAIADAQRRIRTCDTALDILEGLRGCYREAIRLLRRIPGDLGWVYTAIYDLQRHGHDLPENAREWFDVAEVTT